MQVNNEKRAILTKKLYNQPQLRFKHIKLFLNYTIICKVLLTIFCPVYLYIYNG